MPRDRWAKRNGLQNGQLKSTGETPAMLIGVTVPNIGHQRAAKRGDGWRPTRVEPGEIAASRALLTGACRADRGKPRRVPVSMRAALLIAERDLANNGRQFPLMASVDRIVAKLSAYRVAGLDHIVLPACGLNSLEEYKELFALISGATLRGPLVLRFRRG